MKIPPVFICIIYVKCRINSNSQFWLKTWYVKVIWKFRWRKDTSIGLWRNISMTRSLKDSLKGKLFFRIHSWDVFWPCWKADGIFYLLLGHTGLAWKSYYFPGPIYAWYTHKTLISYYLPAFKLSFISSIQVFIVYLSRIVSPAFISQLKSQISKLLSWIYTSIYTTVSPMSLSIIRSNMKSTVEILKTLFLHANNFHWIARLHFYLLLGRSRLANLAMSIFSCSICGINLFIEPICCKL